MYIGTIFQMVHKVHIQWHPKGLVHPSKQKVCEMIVFMERS